MSGGRRKGASIRIIYIQYLLQNIAETCLLLECVKGVMVETCKQMDGELLEFGGEDDHVHLRVAVHPKVAVSHLVSKLKGKSSYVLRRDFWVHAGRCRDRSGLPAVKAGRLHGLYG